MTKKRTAEVNTWDAVRQSKRTRTLLLNEPPSSASMMHHISSIDVNFSKDSLAPPHQPIKHSVSFAPYCRLKPKETVCLSIEDKIILILSSLTTTTHVLCRRRLTDIHQRIDSVLLKLYTGITFSERPDQFGRLKLKHSVTRGKETYFEYAVY